MVKWNPVNQTFLCDVSKSGTIAVDLESGPNIGKGGAQKCFNNLMVALVKLWRSTNFGDVGA
jgi:hypothetical protein